MNVLVPGERNAALATRFVQTLIGWFPKADPDPIWTKQAIDMLAPYPVEVFRALHGSAQKELRGFPSIPTLRQLIDRTLDQMMQDSRKGEVEERKGFQSDWRFRANRAAKDAMRILGMSDAPFLPLAQHELSMWLSDRAWEAIRASKEHATPDPQGLARSVPGTLLDAARTPAIGHAA